MTVDVRAAEPGDFEAWAELFRGYRTFYEYDADEAVVARVWDWIHDPAFQTSALVAHLDGRMVGLAHHRIFERPSSGARGVYLDDLFTSPDVRGQGVGRALIVQLTEIARENGCNKVRWITAADNATAQRLYDDVAERTEWLTYDLRVR